MKVSDIMTRNVYVANENDTVESIAGKMTELDTGFAPVSDSDGQLIGVLTDRDIVLRCVAGGADSEKVRAVEIMTMNTVSVSPENSAMEAARIMAKHKVRRLPVALNGKVVGVVSLGDLSRREDMFAETAAALCDICDSSGDEIEN